MGSQEKRAALRMVLERRSLSGTLPGRVTVFGPTGDAKHSRERTLLGLSSHEDRRHYVLLSSKEPAKYLVHRARKTMAVKLEVRQ
jgi:hypothetical protein